MERFGKANYEWLRVYIFSTSTVIGWYYYVRKVTNLPFTPSVWEKAPTNVPKRPGSLTHSTYSSKLATRV